MEKQTAQGQAQDNAMPDGALQGLNEALGQEFNSKVAAKQNEISVRLNQKVDQLRRDLAGQFDAYNKEMDETYQNQIFSLQLKLKTVQLSKEEMEALQKQLEQLQGERSAKLAAKEKELSGQLEAVMAPEKAAAEKELSAYANEVNTALQQQAAVKSAEIAARMQTAPLQSQAGQGRTETEQKAALKSQEITVLQDCIIKDIQDKTAKIAAERSLEAVLGVYKVNVSAVDITDAVIAEIKK
ncbi:MAG TPA: molecular chaperone Skp [Sporomusaceae bacterium]|nr:molecular chaperone Skp [Sporomusaceae bacterium]